MDKLMSIVYLKVSPAYNFGYKPFLLFILSCYYVIYFYKTIIILSDYVDINMAKINANNNMKKEGGSSLFIR